MFKPLIQRLGPSPSVGLEQVGERVAVVHATMFKPDESFLSSGA